MFTNQLMAAERMYRIRIYLLARVIQGIIMISLNLLSIVRQCMYLIQSGVLTV